jgi:hypothetical protein
MFLQFNALQSVLDDEFYFIFADNRCNFGVFVSVWQTVSFAERGAKRKKENLNYPVRDKNRKIIQQARENLPKDRLFRITQEDACVESAATKSVDLGKDSNFLGSQNFLRSSNHRVGGKAFGSQPNAGQFRR